MVWFGREISYRLWLVLSLILSITYNSLIAVLIFKRNFLLAPKFRQFGVKMGSGIFVYHCIFFNFIYLCLLCFHFDVLWICRYDATIEAYTPNGYYVSYDNWGNKEEVRLVKTTWYTHDDLIASHAMSYEVCIILPLSSSLLFFIFYGYFSAPRKTVGGGFEL